MDVFVRSENTYINEVGPVITQINLEIGESIQAPVCLTSTHIARVSSFLTRTVIDVASHAVTLRSLLWAGASTLARTWASYLYVDDSPCGSRWVNSWAYCYVVGCAGG